jgi:putative ABC transport system permease protein
MRTLWPRLRAADGGPGKLNTAWVTLTGTGAAASVAFGLLVFVSVLASLAIPRESAELSNGALQRVITASQPGDRTVVGSVPETSMTNGSGLVQAADIAAVGASLRAQLAASGMPVASDPPAWASLTVGYVPVTGAARPAGDGPPQFEMTYRTELARYSQIVVGRLPVSGAVTGAVSGAQPGIQAVAQAAVTTTTAARFGLRVGSRLNAGPVQLVITGIIRPANPASVFWSQEPVTARPVLTQAAAPQLPYWIGAVFIGPGALPPIEAYIGTDEMVVTWVYTAALGRVTAGQASGLEANVNSLVSSGATVITPAGNPVTVTISSQIPSILSPFAAGENAVGPALELLYVSLTVIGAVVVLLGARLVAQRRAAEFTLMRARGAALYQLGWLVLRASVVIAAVAGGAAAVLAIGLTPGDGDAVGWWLAGLTIAVTLAGPVLISVVPRRVAAPATGRPERGAAGRRPAARRIVVEIVLVAAAIGGLVVLRDQGLSSGNSGLYTSAAPVLVAIPVAVILLRFYPLLARELARIAGVTRGVVAFVGLARATRTPPGTVLPAFALVLVLAMVAFPDMVSTSVARSQAAESWQQVGADAIVQAPPSGAIPAGLQSQISSLPGVVSTAAAEVDSASLAAGTELSVMYVDPAQYAAVIDRAPGPRFPLAALSGYGGQAGEVVPAVATPAAAQLVGTAPASVNVGTSTITIQLAGRTGVPGVPGAPGVGPGVTVIVPPQASSPLVPNVMLVAGPDLDAARLSADVSSALPGASVTFRATALAALATSPVPQAAQTALTQGMAAAAGFGALVLLLSLLLTAWTRDMTLARLATMGLRRWQAQLLQATETLPPVVAAAIGGVACAWLLVPLVGPSLNLAAFAGTGSAAVVTPAVVPLVGSAAGLVLAALLVLAVQAMITYHRGSARALRISDEGGPGT